jgi:hypothetical protein
VGYDFSSGSNSEGVRLIGSASLRWRLEGATSAIGGRQTRHAKEVADTVAHHIGKTIRTPRVSLALLHTFSGGLDSVISQVVALVGASFGSLMLLRGLCVTWPSAGSGCGYIRTGIFPEQRDQPQFAVQMPAPNSVAIALPLGWVAPELVIGRPPQFLKVVVCLFFPLLLPLPRLQVSDVVAEPRHRVRSSGTFVQAVVFHLTNCKIQVSSASVIVFVPALPRSLLGLKCCGKRYLEA